jgi:hypothetical protein
VNDNTDPKESTVARVLTNSVVIEEHLTVGMSAMLKANGCTPQFQEVMGEFLKPVISLLGAMERDAISLARGQEPSKTKDEPELDRE